MIAAIERDIITSKDRQEIRYRRAWIQAVLRVLSQDVDYWRLYKYCLTVIFEI